MKNDNFYKTLRIVCLILAIVCMALSLFKKAKAAIPSDDYDNIISFISGNNGNYTTLINNWNDINTTANYYVILPNTNGGSLIGYRIYFFQDNYIIPEGDSISGSNIKFYSWYFCYPANNTGGTQYYYDFIINSNNCLLRKCSWRNPAGTSFTYNNMSYVENNGYEGEIINTLSSNEVYRLSMNTISNYNCYSNLETFGFCADNTNPYSTVDLSQYLTSFNYHENNTDGFKVFKITRSGRDYLIFDGLNAVPVNIRNGNWYLTDLTSTLSFTVKTETGSYNYSFTFDIDDASEDFPYNSEFFKWQDNWGNLYLRWEIPIDELNLPDDSYGYTDNVIMTVSNDVSINNVIVPYLGNFIYLTPVYLYGTQAESGLIDPETAPAPVIPENPINQETRNKNYQSLIYGTLLNKSGLEFEEWKQGLQSGIIWYEILVTQSPSLQDLINDFPNFSTSDIKKFVFGCNDKEEFENDMETDLQNNSFSQYIDYIVYIYNGSDAYHSSKFDYYIFETSKGREKAISFLLDTNNTYFDKQINILRESIPYIKDSIDRIDTNIFNLGEDIFSQNNSIIANLISIDNKFNDLEDLIKDFLNKILDAIMEINIDIPEADYTDILEKLDTIINNQDTSDINDDWYRNYREWLYGINENDSYLSPHEYFNNIFGTLKTTFDSFTNNISFNAYLLKVEDFINHISGSTTDNITIYLRDGIGDPSFNINNNYMYTVGGS